jgi:site-specific recombinase XerD
MPSETSSDARLTSLFLDMLAAEQGAGVNTLDAYRGDLEDLSGFLARKNHRSRLPTRRCCATISTTSTRAASSHQASHANYHPRAICSAFF